MNSILVLFGAPGSGKGTQATRLSELYNIPSIATGDLIRAEIKNGTSLGKKVEEYANKGLLVPDSIVMSIFNSFLTPNNITKGFITDGYPRTLAQAEDFDKQLGPSASKVLPIYLKVNTNDLVDRILGRSTCPKCKRVYHDLFKPPVVAGRCDLDQEVLQKRKDDTKEVVSERTNVFLAELKPILNYYGNRMVEIDGNDTMDNVFNSIKKVIHGPNN